MSDVATTETRRALNPMAKLALELGPLVIFFLVNAYADRFGFAQERRIFAATTVFLAATVVSLAIHYVLVRKLPIMPMVSGVSGTCSVTMSASTSNSAREAQGLALPCGSLVVWS